MDYNDNVELVTIIHLDSACDFCHFNCSGQPGVIPICGSSYGTEVHGNGNKLILKSNSQYIQEIRQKLEEHAVSREQREKRRDRFLVEQLKAHEASRGETFAHVENNISNGKRYKYLLTICVQSISISSLKNVIEIWSLCVYINPTYPVIVCYCTFVTSSQSQSTDQPSLRPLAGSTERGSAGEASDTSDSAGAAFGISAPQVSYAEGGDPAEPPAQRAAVPAAERAGLPGGSGQGGGEIGWIRKKNSPL